MVAQAALASVVQPVAAGLADGLAPAGVLVVGGRVPDRLVESLRAYEDGGDRGLRDWMKEFFDDKYVAGWDFVTIDDLGIGTPE